jgi:hypothetical protein
LKETGKNKYTLTCEDEGAQPGPIRKHDEAEREKEKLCPMYKYDPSAEKGRFSVDQGSPAFASGNRWN